MSYNNTVFETRALITYIHTICADTGINVRYSHSAVPSFDGRNITLPYLGAYLDRDDITKMRNWVRHEAAGHASYTSINECQKPGNELWAILSNMVEDVRVDYLSCRRYVGDKDTFEDYLAMFLSDSRRTGSIPENPVIRPTIEWMLAAQDDLGVINAPITEWKLTKDEVHILNTMSDGKFFLEMQQVAQIQDKTLGTRAAVELARKITEAIQGEPPPQNPNYSPDGEKGEDSSDGDEKGDESGECVDEGEDGAPKSGKEQGDPDMEGFDMYKSHQGDNLKRPTPNDSLCVGSEVGSSPYIPYPETVWRKAKDFRDTPYREEDFSGHMKDTSTLSNVLRTHLQTLARVRREYGKKRGKLSKSKVWKVGVKDIPKEQKERVFHQKIENNTLDTAVLILVDNSGSMGGSSKYCIAMGSAWRLGETLANIVRIPTAIWGFTESGGHMMIEYKDWQEVVPASAMAKRAAKAFNYYGGNCDGEAVLDALSILMKRKERRKVLVVLSDGAPAGGRGDTQEHLKMVLKGAEKLPVEIHGVGIVSDSVRHYYKNHVVLNRVSDVEQGLVELLTKNIFVGE